MIQNDPEYYQQAMPSSTGLDNKPSKKWDETIAARQAILLEVFHAGPYKSDNPDILQRLHNADIRMQSLQDDVILDKLHAYGIWKVVRGQDHRVTVPAKVRPARVKQRVAGQESIA